MQTERILTVLADRKGDELPTLPAVMLEAIVADLHTFTEENVFTEEEAVEILLRRIHPASLHSWGTCLLAIPAATKVVVR